MPTGSYQERGHVLDSPDFTVQSARFVRPVRYSKGHATVNFHVGSHVNVSREYMRNYVGRIHSVTHFNYSIKGSRILPRIEQKSNNIYFHCGPPRSVNTSKLD